MRRKSPSGDDSVVAAAPADGLANPRKCPLPGNAAAYAG